MDAREPKVLRFGPFAADLRCGELRKHGIRLRLQQQPFQVLEALLEKPGVMITRQELQQRLWPGTVYVDHERGLNKAVARLREVLGDASEAPRFVETLPQRGYRFIGQLEQAAVTAIAVLPLQNLSGDPAEEYFSDGMTDELIGELARVSLLRVTSRTSVMRYKGPHRKLAAEIARELAIDALLEGTVTRVGDRVRITIQLIRASDDSHLWSHKYERDLRDVLEVQSEVARSVAREVHATLRPVEAQRLALPRRIRPDAYQAFLQGNYFLHQNVRGIVRGIACFRESIELDDAFADSWAGLAQALIFAGIYELLPGSQAYQEARQAAGRALSLDQTNAGAHNALADVAKVLDFDLAAAEAGHRRALSHNPSHLLSRLWLAETLSRLERHTEALEESSRAMALDPVSALSHNNRAMLLWRARRHAEAVEEARVALELDPSHRNALWWLGLAHSGRGEYAESIACLSRAFEATGAPMFLGALGYAYGLSGRTEMAREVLDKLGAMAQTRFVSKTNAAAIFAALGDVDSAFGLLEAAWRERDPRVHQLVTPSFDNLRHDPRFQELKSRSGLR